MPSHNKKHAEPSPSRRSARRTVLIGLGIVLLFYGGGGYAASTQVMGEHPAWRRLIATPADFGLRADLVSFSSADGVPLTAWWLPAQGDARGTLVVAHGQDGNRSHMLSRAAFLVRAGFNVLAIDLRLHGGSQGRYTTPGLFEARDIIGAVQYLQQQQATQPFVVLGHSYGAVAALQAGADGPEIAAVISEGAFVSMSDLLTNTTRYYLAYSGTPWWGKVLLRLSTVPGLQTATSVVLALRTGQWLTSNTGGALHAVTRLTKPVLFIVGERDPFAPPADARRLFDATLTPRKTLAVIPEAGHNTTYRTAPATYEQAVLRFLETVR